MEEFLVTAVGYLRLVVEATGAAVVGFGVIATTFEYIPTLLGLREYSNA
jgi:deoxyinosine 3'endonuclease (endonuclease V)